MCGIAGFIESSKGTDERIIHKMINSLNHRGPDDNGYSNFTFENFVISLGQARLSIIDLSNGGHQPMHYEHFSIVYNGEIYNFKEIKRDLIELGHEFITESDTEVILHAFAEWKESSVDRFIGMFAFAIFDHKLRCIKLFRDRAGVKPLYYYYCDNLFIFGSELKALMAHPKFIKSIDVDVLPNYLQYGYVAAPYTIFKNCKKLSPGHFLTLNCSTFDIEVCRYWSLNHFYNDKKLDISYHEAKIELNSLFRSAFNYRMVSDVPIGVFLSGGYDSNCVVSVLQSEMTSRLKTYTIGFESGNNEAPFAKDLSKYLGTDHTEYICSTKEAQEIIPTLPYYFDEPFGDSSAIPTMLVSRIARNDVTVALSADGGDEIFGGYDFYFKYDQYLKLMDMIPNGMKAIFKSDYFFGITSLISNKTNRYKMESFLSSLNNNSGQQALNLYYKMNRIPDLIIGNLLNLGNSSYQSSYIIPSTGFQDKMELAMCIDFQSFLPNDVLTKVDRATMAFSLEGREPLLDHRIAEFAAHLPLSYKYDGKTGKKILKDIVHDFIPKELIDRPKSGFTLPIYSWLKGDLSYLIDYYLSQDAIKESEVFDVNGIINLVNDFKANRLHYKTLIWNVLMFQIWYFKWIKKQ